MFYLEIEIFCCHLFQFLIHAQGSDISAYLELAVLYNI